MEIKKYSDDKVSIVNTEIIPIQQWIDARNKSLKELEVAEKELAEAIVDFTFRRDRRLAEVNEWKDKIKSAETAGVILPVEVVLPEEII